MAPYGERTLRARRGWRALSHYATIWRLNADPFRSLASKLPHDGRYRPGDVVRVELDGEWIEARYEGFAVGAGHVVRTAAALLILPERDRRLRPA
jgi:hypothetical protein